jgi:preprotein translocase subunit SecG
MQTILLVLHFILGALLVVMVLLQNGSDELKGLGSSNAGSVMSSTASANFATRVTAILATLFIINCLVLSNLASRGSKETIADKISQTQQQPIATEQTSESKGLPIAK